MTTSGCNWSDSDSVHNQCNLILQLHDHIILSITYAMPGLILRKILDCTGGDIYGEREPITGSGGSAPAGSRGRAPGQGAKPHEADSILAFKR